MDDNHPPGFPDPVALNPKFRQQEATLLNALLQSSDYGVLVSGLDREDILANRRLGELFGVSPQQVVRTNPDAVRALALSRVRHPAVFEELLYRAYSDPLLICEDEIELIGAPPRFLRRYTAPIHGSDGQPVGRLWTFLDITETHRLQAEVQAQLGARTREYAATAAILSVMNALCSTPMQRRSAEDLLAALVEQVRNMGRADCAAVLLLPEEGQGARGTPGAQPWLTGMACAPGKPVKAIRLNLRREAHLAQAIDCALAVHPGGPSCSDTPLSLITAPQNSPLAASLKWNTLAVMPLRSGDFVSGVLALGIAPELADAKFNSKGISNGIDKDAGHVNRVAGEASRNAERAPGAVQISFAVSMPLDLPIELRHLNAIADQIALTLQTHHLQSELHTTLDTLQVTQRRMVEMEKLRTAGTLAASVAHDIRNILTSMQMEMEAAWMPAAMPAELRDQLNRFSTLTHRLLAFSRPGRLEMRPVQTGDIIGRVVTLVAGQAQVNRVQIQVELPPHMPLVAADADQLEHLFINLCLNAIQAMNTKGGFLTLRGGIAGKNIEIRVEDTGAGIAPDVIKRVFDPFFTTRATGTGLGLFSCKRIVEEHGGRLTVSGAPGEGAAFTVLLPSLSG